MGLPKLQLPTEDVVLSDGSTINVKGLTRKQTMEMADAAEDIVKAETEMIMHATGSTEQETQDWYASAPSHDVQKIVEAVLRLSGLSEDAPKA